MRISQHATTGHLIVGVLLTLLALICLGITLATGASVTAVMIFFFGVWGGVELGRYLEAYLRRRQSS